MPIGMYLIDAFFPEQLFKRRLAELYKQKKGILLLKTCMRVVCSTPSSLVNSPLVVAPSPLVFVLTRLRAVMTLLLHFSIPRMPSGLVLTRLRAVMTLPLHFSIPRMPSHTTIPFSWVGLHELPVPMEEFFPDGRLKCECTIYIYTR